MKNLASVGLWCKRDVLLMVNDYNILDEYDASTLQEGSASWLFTYLTYILNLLLFQMAVTVCLLISQGTLPVGFAKHN